MIFISADLFLDEAAAEDLNCPVFAWENLVTASNISATSAADGFPASNLGNESTALEWQAAAPASPPVVQYLTVLLSPFAEVDCVAVAVHNLGSAQVPVSIEIATALVGSPPALNWTEVMPDTLQANDEPILWRFPVETCRGVRVRLQQGDEDARIACLFVGKLLVMPRGTHTDHTPINLGRQTEKLNARSTNGHFLGTLILSESRANAIGFHRLDNDWFRAHMDPFIVHAQSGAFWFAQKPTEWPGDVGYCTVINDPVPLVHFDTQTVAIDLQLSGVDV